MAKGREIAAESVGTLLEAARIQQRNGMLQVEYTQGKRREEGEIYLFAGEPIYARTGKLVGNDALNYLLTWHNIYFALVTDRPRPVANMTLPASRPPSVTTPLSRRQLPTTDELKWPGAEQLKAQARRPLEQTSTSGKEKLVPLKNGATQDVFSLGLTRRQRLVYFMIDGQRNLAEIAHTTNRTLLEAEAILNELSEQDLIIW